MIWGDNLWAELGSTFHIAPGQYSQPAKLAFKGYVYVIINLFRPQLESEVLMRQKKLHFITQWRKTLNVRNGFHEE